MTIREKAVVMAYTGVCMLAGADLKYYYDYCSELLGHPAYSHEIYTERIRELSKRDFLKLCEETTGYEPVNER